jgi:uncharacterized protein involved in exopolysaccharide biosynthesis
METKGQILPAARMRRSRRQGLLLATFGLTFTAIFGGMLIGTLRSETSAGSHFFTPIHRLVANVLHPGPDFTATALLIPTRELKVPHASTDLGDLVNDLNLLESAELATAVADSLKGQQRKRFLIPYETGAATGAPLFAPEILKKNRDVQSDPGSGALAVSYTHADAEIATLIAHLYAHEFIQLRTRQKTENSLAALQDAQARLAAAHQKADDARAKLADFSRTQNPSADAAAWQRQLTAAQAQSKKLMAQVEQLQAALSQQTKPAFVLGEPVADDSGVDPKVWRLLGLSLVGGVAGASTATFALAGLLNRRKRWPANFDEMQL